MSKFPSWYFREMEAGEVHVDPVHDEFFKMQDLADALVRESIQNSLDARRGRAPVRVRFAFGAGSNALLSEAASEYLDGLRDHLDAVGSTLHSTIPPERENVPFLLIEDFGTRGLTGDPASDPEIESDGDKNDFFYFWRNVGRSSKGELDRGRWGLGKAVFSVASRIRTMFGLTVRADDNRALLLGQSVLKTHVINGKRIDPYGFFARYERRSGLPLPIEDPLLLDRFADDFRLRRTEPGLSIVVPYYRTDELSFEALIESAVAQYFYPITRGDLIIDVEDGSRVESLTSRTIEAVFARYATGPSASVERLCEFTRWSLATDERLELQVTSPERAPKWSDDMIATEDVEQLRGRLDSGQRVAIRVPLLVKRKKAKSASSFFDVYLERDESLKKVEAHFIRRGITIPDVKSASADKSIRALIVVDHDALSTFLGDAENPAHSDWSERADKLRMLYDHHAATLRLVKHSAAFLASLLTRPRQGRARDFLEDLFSIETPDDISAMAETARLPIRARRGGESEGGTPAGGSGMHGVSIVRIAGGFAIRGSGDDAIVGAPMRAEVAYRVRTGNPFRRHSPFDFNLTRNELLIEADRASVRCVAPNRLEFTAADARFQITMKGFDSHRDVVVRVAELADDAPETELH